MKRIVEAPAEDSLLVDSGKIFGSEEMKVELDEEDRISQINKDIPPAQANGEYIGIAKFSRQGGRVLKGYLDSLIKRGEVDQFTRRHFIFWANPVRYMVSTSGESPGCRSMILRI